MGIDVEATFANEADEGLTAFLGKIDRETGGGGNGNNHRNARRQGFLHDLERSAAAYDQDFFFQGQEGIEQRMAENFVDGVMASNVFADDDQIAVCSEQTGCMEAAGAFECFLMEPQFGGKIDEQLCRNSELCRNRRESFVDGINSGGAAKSAT